MTDKQTRQPKGIGRERVYNFLVGYIMENGYAPSVKEIADGTGLSSTNTVYCHLLKLEEEGKIQMKRGYSPRAIKVVGYGFRKVEDSANG